MKTSPGTEKILDLVNSARSGKVVLPQFQRNFVWSRESITDLLVSIFEGYFIGSFLLLRTDSESLPFATRPIQGVTLNGSQPHPDWMILDGQQRLTSLHYVFAAPPIPLRWTKQPYRFFLNLQHLTDGNWEQAIWSARADEVNDWLVRKKQFQELVIPFTEIESWSKWQRAYEEWSRKKDDGSFDYYWDNYRDAWTEKIDRIRGFQVPTLEIEKINSDNRDGVAQVCAIFEKMNSTGESLSVYDLLTARLYRHGIDLHSMWEQTVDTHELLAKLSDRKSDEYGIYLLRTIGLLRDLDVKSKSLINLVPHDFVKDWKRAALFMERALRRISSTTEEGFGVFDWKWLPYSTMISPMAALLAEIEEKRLGHHAYKFLRRWYWSSVFLERYAGSVESTIYRDYQDLRSAFAGGERTPDVFAQSESRIVNNLGYSLIEENRVNATYRGVMCLVAKRGAKDFAASDSIEFHDLDDHHIFPKAYLERTKRPDGSEVPKELVNSIVNRTLISGDTNRRISKTSPSEYVKTLVPAADQVKIMNSHFIDADAREAMMQNDFEAFLHHRESALLEELRAQLTLGQD